MRYILSLLLAAVAVSAIYDNERSRLAYQNPDLFEGDILGIDPTDRNVIPNTQMRWPNKTIPYVIDTSLSYHTSQIEKAMKNYHRKTCLRFVKRTTEKNYIRLFYGQGCYSLVGMYGRGEQPLSLGDGCIYPGLIIHELGHAIGFYHEQNRSDRDEYLIIYWKNIQEGMESQFNLLKPDENLLLTPFDHDSIMLYGNYAFSRGRKLMTMAAKNGKELKEPYTKFSLSPSDSKRVNMMYNC